MKPHRITLTQLQTYAHLLGPNSLAQCAYTRALSATCEGKKVTIKRTFSGFLVKVDKEECQYG